MMPRQMALGEICEFIRGVSFDGDESLASHIDGYTPILRAGNIADELNTDSDLIFVPAQRVSESQYLKHGDIVICMSSGSSAVLGKTASLKAPFSGSVGAFCGIIRAVRMFILSMSHIGFALVPFSLGEMLRAVELIFRIFASLN